MMTVLKDALRLTVTVHCGNFFCCWFILVGSWRELECTWLRILNSFLELDVPSATQIFTFVPSKSDDTVQGVEMVILKDLLES